MRNPTPHALLPAALAGLLALPGSRPEAAVTTVHLSSLDLAQAKIQKLKSLPFEDGLLEGSGSLLSPPQEAEPFDALVGSFNALLPPGGSAELSVQVRVEGRWSGFYRLPLFSPGGSRSFERQEDDWGYVEADTLKLKRKAQAFRYRLRLRGEGRRAPILTRVSVATEDFSRPRALEAPFAPGPWVRELILVPRSQMEVQEAYRRDICSPTSLAMVLEFWGRPLATRDVVLGVLDQGAGIYGNWTLNVALAAQEGLAGEVAWLPSLEGLQSQIAQGRPVVVSIAFSEGQLSGAPLARTPGHLLVVAGFTAQGDVIAYDPAAPSSGSVRRVYARGEFAEVWGRKRGLSYLIGPRLPELLAVGAPSVELRKSPAEPKKPDPLDPDRISQLLYGESVRVLAAQGEWAQVLALSQTRRSPEGDWGGYPGWVRAAALKKPVSSWRADAVLRTKRTDALLEDGKTAIPLPMGAYVQAAGGSRARLLDGRSARLPADHLRLLPYQAAMETRRRDIVESASQFLGDLYVWGGLSSLQRKPSWGVDCSGLAHLAYRCAGLELPRDAQDQYLKALPLSRRELKPGDLVFLSSPKDPSRVDHVLLYTGGEGLLESCQAVGKTLRTTFQKRFGAPLGRIEGGDALTDLSTPERTRRSIFFGSFLR